MRPQLGEQHAHGFLRGPHETPPGLVASGERVTVVERRRGPWIKFLKQFYLKFILLKILVRIGT